MPTVGYVNFEWGTSTPLGNGQTSRQAFISTICAWGDFERLPGMMCPLTTGPDELIVSAYTTRRKFLPIGTEFTIVTEVV